MEKFKSNPLVKTLGFNRIILVGVLIALYLLFSLFSGRVLGSVDIMNVLNSVDFMGFLTIGVMFVIATGGIDFSIGPVMYVLCGPGCRSVACGRRAAPGAVPAHQHPCWPDIRCYEWHHGCLHEASFVYLLYGFHAYRAGHRVTGNKIRRSQLAKHRVSQ